LIVHRRGAQRRFASTVFNAHALPRLDAKHSADQHQAAR
jgi:hypothetical protein